MSNIKKHTTVPNMEAPRSNCCKRIAHEICWVEDGFKRKGNALSTCKSMPLDNTPDAFSGEEFISAHQVNRLKVSLRGKGFELDLDSMTTSLIDRPSKLTRLANKWNDMISKNIITPENASKIEPIYFNKSPTLFHCILDFYITGELHLPEGLCGKQLKTELKFWELDEDAVAPCCLRKLRDGLETAAKVSDILQQLGDKHSYIEDAKRSLRNRIWSYYAYPFQTRQGTIFYTAYIIVYILFIVLFTLESFSLFRVPISSKCNITDETTITEYLDWTKPHPYLRNTDITLLCIISIYNAAMIIISPYRKLILKDPLLLLCNLGLVILWVNTIYDLFFLSCSLYPNFLRYMKLGRVFPILHILRPFRSIHIVKKAIADSWRELLMLAVLLALNAVVFGYLGYIFETRKEGSHIQSTMDGIWWGFVTMTTVGYGDIYPQTLGGRTAGVLCTLIGILVIAMPVPIIARNFTKIYELTEIADYRRSICKDRK